MNWNKHYDMIGKHSILPPSSAANWLKYSDERFQQFLMNYDAAERGTKTHEFAAECIRRRQNLPKSKKTLNQYVNDAIGYHMTPELPLVYSDVLFGTTDAICYDEKEKFLRIHDLKTGTTKVHDEQLFTYEALFCLEYGIKPGDIGAELRFYQNNDIYIISPTPEQIVDIMNICVKRSKELIDWKMQGGLLP